VREQRDRVTLTRSDGYAAGYTPWLLRRGGRMTRMIRREAEQRRIPWTA
jgi:hypothetical protein